MRFLAFFGLPLLFWLLFTAHEQPAAALPADKINLALRRTADGLLRLAGDSTSRIPAVEHYSSDSWKIRFYTPFRYDDLPPLLEKSLQSYGIRTPYEVAVRRCNDDLIDLGYQQADLTQDSTIPCLGRDMPDGCHYIQVSFELHKHSRPVWSLFAAVLLLLSSGFGIWWFLRKKPQHIAPERGGSDWLELGKSRLNAPQLLLICNGVEHRLTFREAKLLRLFAAHPNQLLEREFILQQVWADEGIWVGRSVDVFVSRLRKKLAADPSLAIAAVHGLGYRLEVK